MLNKVIHFNFRPFPRFKTLFVETCICMSWCATEKKRVCVVISTIQTNILKYAVCVYVCYSIPL